MAEDFRVQLGVAEDLFGRGYEVCAPALQGASDVMAHRKGPVGKRDAIAAVDRVLIPLVRQVEARADLLVVVTGDHATLRSGSLIRSGEAIPLLIAGSAEGPNVLADVVRAFHERAVIRGGLGRIAAGGLMPILFNVTDRICLYGVRHQRQAVLATVF